MSLSPRQGMKYQEVDTSHGEVDRMILDPEWVFEQKFDGTHVVAVVRHGQPVLFLQSGGRVLTHSAATQWLPALRAPLESLLGADPTAELVVAGELMIRTGEYHLFDLAYLRIGGVEQVLPEHPYHHRRAMLNGPIGAALGTFEVLNPGKGQPIRISGQAHTPRQKRALLEGLRKKGGEGVMAKHTSHPFEPGKRSKLALKLKFVKSADVIVMGVSRPDATHGNFQLACFQDPIGDGPDFSKIIPVGAASAIGKDTSIVEGDVVEIRYLYWTGEKIYQPAVLRKRYDKDPRECTMDQFPAYSRDIAPIELDMSDIDPKAY